MPLSIYFPPHFFALSLSLPNLFLLSLLQFLLRLPISAAVSLLSIRPASLPPLESHTTDNDESLSHGPGFLLTSGFLQMDCVDIRGVNMWC